MKMSRFLSQSKVSQVLGLLLSSRNLGKFFCVTTTNKDCAGLCWEAPERCDKTLLRLMSRLDQQSQFLSPSLIFSVVSE